ncbi:MAG: Radical [Chloroflexi bacterium]|jgi:MoaA/NifB/PqqE/SkfB family radical SAM enzyme|nr:Radical [Chloroflexota bacterium]
MGLTSGALAQAQLSFIWLELTGKCQLHCRHCYAESGPRGTHGSMTRADWTRVIDEAVDLGVSLIQFIGGEPTLHPDFPALVCHAARRGVGVEIFSNMVRVTDELWRVFEHPGVRLACSYYSGDAREHDAITGRRSHEKTLANVREAVRRGIRLRVAVISMTESQDVNGTVNHLRHLGVEEVDVDRLRHVGRGIRDQEPAVDQLCGRCADGVLAVTPGGEVLPCVFARSMVIGSVRHRALAEINSDAAPVRAKLAAAFSRRATLPPDCQPVKPDGGCRPAPCKPILQRPR